MSQIEKFRNRLMSDPIPNDITFDKMSRFLLNINCKMRRRIGTSHRQFEYPGYPEIITLMGNENIKEYQIKKIRELVRFIEEENK